MRAVLLVLALIAPACGRVDQSASCRDYVACVRAIDVQDGVTTDAVRFEPAGDCWTGPKIAELCDRACTRGLETLGCAVTP